MAQWTFAFSRSEVGHWGELWDMVGVGDEDTTTMSMWSFWCFAVCFGQVSRYFLLFPFLALGM